MNLIGELLRYGPHKDNLLIVDNVEGHRVYGQQLMGGRTAVDWDSNLKVTNEDDWWHWDSCEPWRMIRRKNSEAAGKKNW